jgi:Tfp pilus assembly ATPase PilU
VKKQRENVRNREQNRQITTKINFNNVEQVANSSLPLDLLREGSCNLIDDVRHCEDPIDLDKRGNVQRIKGTMKKIQEEGQATL